MKAKSIFCLLSIGIFLTSVNAYERIPKTISPGSDDGVAVVAQSCPTFSWTAVEWAEAYRIAVFEVVGAEALTYEEMEALSLPVISKEIHGRALSWTPSSDERLVVGGEYAWYVQAMDSYGQELWSEGKKFRVDVGLRFDGVDERVRKRLKSQGVSDEVIEDVLEDMKLGVKEVIAYGIDTKGLSDSIQNKVGIQDLEGEGATNTFFGLSAGDSTTGDYNSFFGRSAGFTNSTGHRNTFVGYEAGHDNLAGVRNTFLGGLAGRRNTSGDRNTFVGFYAGYWNLTGYENTFIGNEAGVNNTSGISNVFLGYRSGYENTWGGTNTFIGYKAGYDNTKNITNTHPNSLFNTFIGCEAGRFNTSGNSNTFIGQLSGYTNKTGDNNVFLGQAAGFSNETGDNNVFLGEAAGFSNQIGGFNVFLGMQAGFNNKSYTNVFLGGNTGLNNETGSGNIFLGYFAGYNETGSDKLYIDNSDTSSPLIYGEFDNDIVTINGQLGVGTQSPGYPMELERTGTNASIIVDRTDGAMNYINATASFANFGSVRSHPLRLVVDSLWRFRLDSDNSLTMKNGATCTAGGEWQNASSRDLKENIRDLTTEEAEEALEGLAPVRFNYKVDKQDGSVGFIAEDVPELVATKDRKGMSAMDVVAVLTKVVQEQQETISELKDRIVKLEKR